MSGFLVDTNVLSEFGKTKQPDANVQRWLERDLREWFKSRLLPVTKTIANRWGVLAGKSKLQGRALTMADGILAATALEHDLTLVTRNVKDFAGLGLTIFNPWEA
jgi:predicted nucleic acid-binding protein